MLQRRSALEGAPITSRDTASPARVPLRRVALIAGVLASLALALAAALYEALPAGRSQAPASARAQSLVREGLLGLPLTARASVSEALGADSPAYYAYSSAGAITAANPAERLRSTFTAAGASVAAGGTRVGLRLAGIGYGSHLAPVGATAPRVHANRVTYSRPGLSEWYVNGPLGLEQGFDVARAPSGAASGPLTLAVALSGNARATLAGDSQSVTLKGAGGRSLRYSRLSATDASGRALHSWLALEGGRLLLRVDARGARYPLRIDPLVQDGSKLTGKGESGKGEFGWSVAISANGTTALVGGPRGNTTGGAAWVFTRTGTTWTQQGEKLVPSEVTPSNEFGYSVALSAEGNTALIGARGAPGGGGAWVFTRSGSTWTQQAELKGEGEVGAPEFGRAVALSAEGNIALVERAFGQLQRRGVGVHTFGLDVERTGQTHGRRGERRRDLRLERRAVVRRQHGARRGS